MSRSHARRVGVGVGVGVCVVALTLAAGAIAATPQAAPLLAPPAAVPPSADVVDQPPPPPTLTPDEAMTVDLGDRRVRLRLATSAPETGLPLDFTVEVLDANGAPLSASASASAAVELPRPGAVLGEFEVVAAPPSADAAASTDAASPRRWSLRTFGSGSVELPAIDVALDGRTGRTEPRTIEIASVAGLETDPSLHRDIADAVEVTPPGAGMLPWLLGGLGVAALAAVAIWWWRRPSPPTPPEPADRWAIGRLDALLAEGLVERGRVQAFYFGLTDIVRAFIERRYDLAAPDRTTAEFIDEARRHPELGDEAASLLGNLLKSADMVKFAGDRPQSRDCERAAETVRRFVIDAGPRPALDDADGRTASTAGRGDHRRGAIADAVDGLDRLERRS